MIKILFAGIQEYAKIEGRIQKKHGSLPMELLFQKKEKRQNITILNKKN